MIVGALPGRPAVEPLFFLNCGIVYANVACFHQSGFIELPVFIPVRAVPLAGIVMPFVGEADGDTVRGKRP